MHVCEQHSDDVLLRWSIQIKLFLCIEIDTCPFFQHLVESPFHARAHSVHDPPLVFAARCFEHMAEDRVCSVAVALARNSCLSRQASQLGVESALRKCIRVMAPTTKRSAQCHNHPVGGDDALNSKHVPALVPIVRFLLCAQPASGVFWSLARAAHMAPCSINKANDVIVHV